MSDESESKQRSTSIASHLSLANDAIHELTSEQFHVIRQLKGVRRALAVGTAGSGKTVVACEKAMRLDSAGLRTMLVCHNPWLASHLEAMTAGSEVKVIAFGDFVRENVSQRSLYLLNGRDSTNRGPPPSSSRSTGGIVADRGVGRNHR